MAYLNCPTCRLTVYRPTASAISEDCPRCRAKLGKVSRLFKSAVPPRLQDRRDQSLRGGSPGQSTPAH